MSNTTWPHIPWMQWEIIDSFNLFWLPVSNVVFSTWIFMFFLIIVLICFKLSLKKEWGFFKTTGLFIVWGLYELTAEFIWNRKFARKVVFLVGWMFLFVLLSNIFSLCLDWIIIISGKDLKLYSYLRPINSDLNTTAWLAISIVVISQCVSIYHKWFFKHFKWFLFNFSGHGLFEKCVNVFVGWLHAISELIKVLSLSLRLFGNIFAGVVLIGIITFLTGKLAILGLNLWEIFVLPFWLFELFVAFVQAVIFFVLSSIYFQQALEENH